MKQLQLSDRLYLPLETVTQAIGILAKRRAGKSYAARRLAEQLFKAGQQIVIVDPKGDWHGIRASADGKGPGLPVIILGGERGDLPLEVNAGEVVAKLVVEERVSVLLDLSLLRKHEVATFMGHFLESLYRLKAREQYRTPLMLIIDEADAIAPQKPFKGEERMLGAAEDIVRRGGQRGIGCALITQRSAVLNKNVLTQIQMLVVLRTISPQDLTAIDAWIEVHGTEEEQKILKASLPSLPTGDAWFWSPGWPTVDGIFERVHILPIETFDSGATPKPGEKRVEPKNLADVDLDALSRQMAATIEKAKADDPKELRKQIADLKKHLAAKTPAPAKPVETIKEVRAVDKETVRHFLTAVETVGMRVKDLREIATHLDKKADEIKASLAKINSNGHKPVAQLAQGSSQVHRTLPERKPAPVEPRSSYEPNGDSPLSKGELTILRVAVQFGSVTHEQIAVLTGYKATSRREYSRSLIAKGMADRDGDSLKPTEAGTAAAGDVDTPPQGEELIDWWRNRLSGGELRIFEVLTSQHGNEVTNEAIQEATGYKATSVREYTRKLAARRIVETVRGGARAALVLFN